MVKVSQIKAYIAFYEHGLIYLSETHCDTKIPEIIITTSITTVFKAHNHSNSK